MEKTGRMTTADMTRTAVATALICIAGPLSIAAGPVPLSMATFAVYLSGTVLGGRRGALATGLYLLIGLIGIPVFSGFTGGFQKLAGVTGGYLVGYLPCAFLSGLGTEKAEASGGSFRLIPAMVLGTLALYTLGTAWFVMQTGNGLGAALSLCVLPFLPGDAAKMVAVALLTGPIRKALRLNR